MYSLVISKDEITCVTMTAPMYTMCNVPALATETQARDAKPQGYSFPNKHPSALTPVQAWSCSQNDSNFYELGTIFGTVAMIMSARDSAPTIHTRRNVERDIQHSQRRQKNRKKKIQY